MKKAVILNDTSGFHHGCDIVMKNIVLLLKLNDIEVIANNNVSTKWTENKLFLNACQNADIAIINGEGSIHHNVDNAIYILSFAKYIKECCGGGVPVVLMNTIYQDNSRDVSCYLRYIDLIYVRETFSKNELLDAGISSTVCPDMSFYKKFDLSNKSISNRIGFTDSVFIDASEYLYNKYIKQYKYLPIVTDAKFSFKSKKFIRYTKYKIFKFVKYLLYIFGIPQDHSRIRSFYHINNYERYIYKISTLKFIITGRFHSLCFALKTLTPFIAIKSNSFKIEGLLYDIGLSSKRIIEVSDIDNIKLSKEIISFNNDEINKIQNYVNSAPFRIEKMFNQIRELIDD